MANSEDSFGEGVVIDSKQWHSLNSKMGQIIPEWLIDLFTTYPLSYAILEITDEDDEEMEYALEFVCPESMENESIEAYPGCAILELGYICIAEDPTGGGDPYFISISEGDNPPVYQIYHDVGDVGEEILAEGRQRVANSLSELFERGQLTG